MAEVKLYFAKRIFQITAGLSLCKEAVLGALKPALCRKWASVYPRQRMTSVVQTHSEI